MSVIKDMIKVLPRTECWDENGMRRFAYPAKIYTYLWI